MLWPVIKAREKSIANCISIKEELICVNRNREALFSLKETAFYAGYSDFTII